MDSVIPRRGVFIGRESRVVHSVLSPGVRIQRSAEVRNSILLDNVRVGAAARIQGAILDENVRIADGVELGYDVGKDREYGLVTESGIVVIPANTYVAPSQSSFPPHAKWTTEVTNENPMKSRCREGSRLR